MENEENDNINIQIEINDNKDDIKNKDNNDKLEECNNINNKHLIDEKIEIEFENIKNTGKSQYPWNELQKMFIESYKIVINTFNSDLNDSLNNKTNYIDNDIIEYLNSLTKIPFTLQRMAELIVEPQLYYTCPDKYNNAFKKLVNIEFE